MRRTEKTLWFGAFGLWVLSTVPLGAQDIQMQAVGATSRNVTVGSTVRLEVRLTRASEPVVQYPVTFSILSSPGGVSLSPNPRFTDSFGVAYTNATVMNPGLVRIDASADGTNLSVSFFLNVAEPAPPTPVPARLEPITPLSLTLVVGDRQTFAVRVLDLSGRPVSGISLTWTVESSPGSPRAVQATTPSDANGVATGTFAFSVPGLSVLRASFENLPPARFQVETRSLAELLPAKRRFSSVATALDNICRQVFSGPEPQPTPLCVYMTSTLQTRSERSEAMTRLTPAGAGSQTQSAVSAVRDQTRDVVSRLSALRAGAVRNFAGSVAFSLNGREVFSSETLAAAWSGNQEKLAFEQKIDRALARFLRNLSLDSEGGGSGPEVTPRRERPWGFFLTGRMLKGDHSEGLEEPALRLDSKGFTLGLDRAVRTNDFLGIAFSANQAETALKGASGNLDLTAYTVLVYGILEGNRGGYLQLGASYGQSQFEQQRELALPRIGLLKARADFDGSQYGGFLEAGWAWEGQRATATLFGRSSYLRAQIDAFAERGARAAIPGTSFGEVDFGVAVEEQTVTSWQGEAGFDLSAVLAFPGGVVVPQLNATYVREFENDPQGLRGRFLADTAAAASFQLFTDEPDRSFLRVGASLRAQFLWGSVFLAYDEEFQRNDMKLRTWNGGLRLEF